MTDCTMTGLPEMAAASGDYQLLGEMAQKLRSLLPTIFLRDMTSDIDAKVAEVQTMAIRISDDPVRIATHGLCEMIRSMNKGHHPMFKDYDLKLEKLIGATAEVLESAFQEKVCATIAEIELGEPVALH